MSTINIAIGQAPFDSEALTSWEINETDAPPDYDGFGTFQIYQHGNIRTVLIRCEHWNWQTTRYQSGNHWHRPSPFQAEDVKRFLWDRVLGRNQ